MSPQTTDDAYSKLANLGVVNAHNLIFLGGTKTETGDQVHEE